MQLFRRTKLLGIINNHAIQYPTPKNFNYFWGFGSLAGICLVIQIISGIFLAMHYAPNHELAFSCIEHIMRDVPWGWALRYTHSNGASIFFIIVYIHIARGLYYGSYIYPRHFLWFSGVVIFILMMATAFMGYVLPWGQMSFWGATVITNLFSALPYIGQDIAYLLWGGYSVSNPTLNRFFSLHYLLPFIILGAVGLHLILLHEYGSSNPLNVHNYVSKIPFYPYFYVKDLFGFILLMLLFVILVCFMPNYLGHPDNYIKANPMVTPAHIVPEWYFLPFYAILRSIPNKLGGVLCMGLSLVILFFLPKFYGESKSTNYISFLNSHYLVYNFFFWIFIFNCIFLGWIGTCPVEDPYLTVGQFCTFIYFITLSIVPILKFIARSVLLDITKFNSDFLFSTFKNIFFLFCIFICWYYYFSVFKFFLGLYLFFLIFLLFVRGKPEFTDEIYLKKNYKPFISKCNGLLNKK